jgi:hypothetical protein
MVAIPVLVPLWFSVVSLVYDVFWTSLILLVACSIGYSLLVLTRKIERIYIDFRLAQVPPGHQANRHSVASQ